MTCDCSLLRETGGFNSFPDYESHLQLLRNSDLFSPVVVGSKYTDIGGLEEFWFECKRCGSVWRLVEPDPPFRGMWAKV